MCVKLIDGEARMKAGNDPYNTTVVFEYRNTSVVLRRYTKNYRID